ncbi:MAG: hypothetical protein QNI87_09620 [Erythrobacter sp.]|uniref:hypothetical protein n=1 Tax=Erythrobacter sp. TaxID=1042 RepID=UPI00262FEEEB|nr:hypothetical protein [Erythrobacter sp.]MDJ0978784.1 hypothetical protein [Erythrobacter sp.]
MYSEDDINSAVAAGALSAEAAASFRSHISRARALPRQSEENFKLINSFNDIFVAIGIVILLVAVGAIGQALGGVIAPVETAFEFFNRVPEPSDAQREAWRAANGYSTGVSAALAGLFVTVTAWPLSEFFTRARRMALPSILLLLAFVGGAFVSVFGVGMALGANVDEGIGALLIVLSGLIAAGAALLHWRRFQVPITVAAATGVAVVSLLFALAGVLQIEPDTPTFLVSVLVAGGVVFTLAMRWDMSDLERTTRRSDVAFWMHLVAAPLIAHPVFALIGVTEGVITAGAAFAVLGVYIAFGLVALAIDRRALLVSALAYVLFALAFLFREFGAVELGFALTALIIGSALLSLSAFWQTIRAAVVGALPETVQAKLPKPEMVVPLATTRPAL